MGYGPNKYTGKQFLDAITDHIKAQLERQGEFQNNSLGYFGVEFNYKVEVRLLARGETRLVVLGAGAAVGIGADGEPDPECVEAGMNSTSEDVKATVTIEGGSKAGTANQTQVGEHKKAEDDKRLRQRENIAKGSKELATTGKGTGGR